MIKKITALLLCVVLCFSVPVFAEDATDLTESQQEYLNELMYQYYDSVIQLIEDMYRPGGISKEDMYGAFIKEVIGTDPDMVEAAIRAAAGLLDDNSFYLSHEDYEKFYKHLAADYCGIGVVVTSMNGPVTVTGYPSDKSPAKSAGIVLGDVIISVDGVSVSGKTSDEVGEMIKGPKGSTVKLGIKHRDSENTVEISVIRDTVEQSMVSYKAQDGIMYIRLMSFNEGCSEKVQKALDIADKQGIKKIILDLRNNGGGFGSEVYKIASMFLPKDMLITKITYNNGELDETYRSTANFRRKKYETAVLVNEGSASSSEMLAGALKDNGIGYLVGVSTYGKSSGQQVYPLKPVNGYLKLTVSQYCTPSGEVIDEGGIFPDRFVKNTEVPLHSSGKFKKISFERKLREGDSGEDVSAIKEHLNILGYYVGDTNSIKFDSLLKEVTAKFQSDSGLYPYGVMDNATMLALYNATNALKVEEDNQFKAAKEYLESK